MSRDLTIIIATAGRVQPLERSLQAVDAAVAAAGGAHRVVVVDNGLDYPAGAVVDAWRARAHGPLDYLLSEHLNKAKALNAGIREAATEWVAFTDDDTVADPAWLCEAQRFIAQEPYRVFGGRVVPGQPTQALPRWMTSGRSGRVPEIGVFVAYDPLSMSGALEANQTAPFGANLFVKRELFEQVGGYDEGLWALCAGWPLGSEDSEFGCRLKALGEPIGYCQEAVVLHPVNHDRCSLRLHLRRAYYEGWRQPLIFLQENRSRFERYRLRLLGSHLLAMGRWLLLGDSGGAAHHLVEAARVWGMLNGRLSRAYGVREAAVRRAGPGTGCGV